MDNRSFKVGYVKYMEKDQAEMFLSVTPGFEHGPGIQRDGITSPHMTDPHCVASVCHAHQISLTTPAVQTENPFRQRAGTWTIYNHLFNFHNTLGREGWQILGAQGHGDLTMNYWHVAYCNQPKINAQPVFCRLATQEDHGAQERYDGRVYRSLIKWKDPNHRPRVEIKDVTFRAANIPGQVTVHLGSAANAQDITTEVELVMAGKPMIQDRLELPLFSIIEKFEDARHIFALPEVRARGVYNGQDILKAILGEFELFNNINVRRTALNNPVIIPLNLNAPAGALAIGWDSLKSELEEKHFTFAGTHIPTLAGEFRKFPGNSEKIEIFFPRNVYPFGVLGIQLPPDSRPEQMASMICFSSGGLSGRVGNTLEGINRIMYDFLACSEAMVLDEGYDVFQLVNPLIDGQPKFTNEQILGTAAVLSKRFVDEESVESQKIPPGEQRPRDVPPRDMPLNHKVFQAVDGSPYFQQAVPEAEVFTVPPQRCQIRAVLIFARRIRN